MSFYVGTASWAIPNQHRQNFEIKDSILQSYATRFNAVEINSSFYREHKPSTYAKWRETVPNDFRFSVKLSRIFTHDDRLSVSRFQLKQTLEGIFELKEKLGCLLVQLPPSLNYESDTALNFFAAVREFYVGPLAFEPRHITWDRDEARELLSAFSISRVFTDPQPYFSRELELGDYNGLLYKRLHGSPSIYRSSYEKKALASIAKKMKHAQCETWCIFDNTTLGFATENALLLNRLLE